MKLTKFEQSGFIFETNNGFRLGIDIASRTPMESLEGLKVDAMIVSHLHQDHFSISHINKLSPVRVYLSNECISLIGEEKVNGEVVAIASGSDAMIDNIKVKIFDVDHGPNPKLVPKENFGFIFTIDGETIYFAGDMFYPSGVDVSNLEVDYALLPVGEFYTFGPQEALDFAKKFKKIGKIIAMHDRGVPEATAQFLKLAEGVFNAQ
ncbi:MAG: MBL fold metallo-hydrolase [Candidatus Pacebacteria bacterium]|nr:MBL fold metallo-hydrolase [Candidatus Paceibacterota bacterium]